MNMDNDSSITNELLRQYGGISQNDLGNLTDSYQHHDNEIDIIHQSPYYATDDIPSFLDISNDRFNILSLNTGSLLAKLDELKILLYRAEQNGKIFHAITIQESWLDNSTSMNIDIEGYDSILQGKYCGNKGGLVTYIKSDFTAKKLDICPKSDSWEALFVDIRHEETNFNLILGNIYKPPRDNNNNDNIDKFMKELNPVLDTLDSKQVDVALAGDYNINLLQINERLKFSEFFDNMLSRSFYPKITFPTRMSTHSGTLIDNIFCKLSDKSLNSDAGIIFSNLSDHFPQFVSIKMKINTQKCATKFVNQKLSNNALNKLKDALCALNIHEDLEQNIQSDPNANYASLVKKVTEVKSKFIPNRLVKFNKHRHKKNKWITNGILRSIKYRDNLHMKLRRLDRDTYEYATLKTNIKVYNSILKKSIKEAKILYYSETFEKYKSDMKNTWKHISHLLNKSNKRNSVVKQIVKNGCTINDPVAMANCFNTFFANIGHTLASKIDTNNKKPYGSYLDKAINTSFDFDLITQEDTSKLINSMKNKDSTGHDGISVKLLKFLSPALIPSLTLIINQSLLTGIFPDQLKIAKVIPLYKKENPEIVDNYRPVSLLNAFSKVFERAAYNQLYNYFKTNNLFYKNQYGFRDLHSTELASLELIDRVLNDLDAKNNPITVFMDLSKAFDTLDHNILIHKLKYYGVNGTALAWFSSYLTNRNQYVELNSVKSSLLPIKTGVPQGSILGPLLFLIYMNDIPQASSYFDFILFADDTSLKSFINTRISNITKNHISYSINLELAKVNDWLAVNKLSLNVKKTKFMVFHTTQKNILPYVPELEIGGVSIDRVSNFNFLGLTINENLSWKPHVDLIANKLSKYVGILNRLKRYLPQNILKTLYFSLIQSSLNYSLLAWGFNCGRLKTLQKKVIRIITNSKYNAHTEPIMKDLGILKLEDLFKLNMCKWYYRFIHKELPEYFLSYTIRHQFEIHNYNTRHNSYVLPPAIRIKAARYCLRNHISVVINAIPSNVITKIETHSYKGFSTYAKNTILSTYSKECSIEHCYICNS